MSSTDSLTAQERASARQARFDLASGYPLLQSGLLQSALGDESTSAGWHLWGPDDEAELATTLATNVALLLGLRPGQQLLSTFSGSVALNVAVAAARQLLGESKPIALLSTSPSIDIVPKLVASHGITSHSFLDSELGPRLTISADQVEESIRTVSKRSNVVVIVGSPENPTGAVWSTPMLADLCQHCERVGAVLVVDHAFLLAGIQDVDSVPRIWQVAAPGRWLGIWDTGKTFGLFGDKLGFLVPGSAEVAGAVSDALELYQFDMARRQQAMFAALSDRASALPLLKQLQDACRRNRALLSVTVGGIGLEVVDAAAGSFGLVELPHGVVDGDIAMFLRSRGSGVVAASPFFHTAHRRHDLLRVALSREESYFETAVGHLARSIQDYLTSV